jgi:hypothetical protein
MTLKGAHMPRMKHFKNLVIFEKCLVVPLSISIRLNDLKQENE